MPNLNIFSLDILVELIRSIIQALDEPDSRERIDDLTARILDAVRGFKNVELPDLTSDVGKAIDLAVGLPAETYDGEPELFTLASRALRLRTEMHKDDHEDYLEKDIILDVMRERVRAAWMRFESVTRGKWEVTE